MSLQHYTADAHKTVCTIFFFTVYVTIGLSVILLLVIPALAPHTNYWLITCGITLAITAFSQLLLRTTGKQLYSARQQTTTAQMAMLHQKKHLRIQLKKRTSQLRQMQIEEMRQMYRFAELGQMGVTLLHDLANHLSALTLEIEGIQSKQRSKDIDRAREIIRYLENIVDDTRERLHATPQHKTFNIIKEVEDVVSFLHFKAAKADVELDWQRPAKVWKYTGDSTQLCQVIAIIINNAIDAYVYVRGGPLFSNRRVVIRMERDDKRISISVSDWGRGISKSARKQLFKPFHSTKKSGLGLGLFIAKQTIEAQFSGTIAVDNAEDHTEFVITLPFNDGSGPQFK